MANIGNFTYTAIGVSLFADLPHVLGSPFVQQISKWRSDPYSGTTYVPRSLYAKGLDAVFGPPNPLSNDPYYQFDHLFNDPWDFMADPRLTPDLSGDADSWFPVFAAPGAFLPGFLSPEVAHALEEVGSEIVDAVSDPWMRAALLRLIPRRFGFLQGVLTAAQLLEMGLDLEGNPRRGMFVPSGGFKLYGACGQGFGFNVETVYSALQSTAPSPILINNADTCSPISSVVTTDDGLRTDLTVTSVHGSVRQVDAYYWRPVPAQQTFGYPQSAGHELGQDNPEQAHVQMSPGVFPSLFPLTGPTIDPAYDRQPVPVPMLPQFNRLAAAQSNPQVMREVGNEAPGEGAAVEPESRVRAVPGVAVGVAAGAAAAQEPFEVPMAYAAGYPGGPVGGFVEPIVPFAPPPPGVRDKKLARERAIAKLLVEALAVAQYSTGTIRNLWQSLPKGCRSPSKTGRRRYSSMLGDVFACMGQVDWNGFAQRETLMLAKYRFEGQVISALNKAGFRSGITGPYSPGLATDAYHLAPLSGESSPYGGPFGGHLDPLGGVGKLIDAMTPFLRG